MGKVIQFSKEEKSLIYNRFVAPVNGTTDEVFLQLKLGQSSVIRFAKSGAIHLIEGITLDM